MSSRSKSALWPGVILGVVLVASTTFLVARVSQAGGTANSASSSHSKQAAVSASSQSISPAATPTVPASQWVLTWQDNFNTAAGLSTWWYENGNVGGPALGQLQWYDKQNATTSNGSLVMTATAGGGGHSCFSGPCQYTSVRMQTFFAQAYGLFEARIKIPEQRGLWPAFWMQGDNFNQVGLPAAGEIDIAELNNQDPPTDLTSYAHAPGHFYYAPTYTMPQPLSAGFHVYAVEWTTAGITFLVDGKAYAHMNSYPGWPFNHPFNIILQLAVGGNWPGPPTSSTRFPASMYVDWVRVYRQA